MYDDILSTKVVKYCEEVGAELIDDDESGCTYQLDSEEAGNRMFIYIDYDLDRVSVEEFMNGAEVARKDFDNVDDFQKIKNILV